MTKKAKQKTPLEREVDQLIADGYTPIHPDHNAINTLLADLGKADLSPREVEALCQTAKVAGLNGFTRIDLLPCGCSRIYKGMIVGFAHNPQTYALRVGGVEGVKPCPKHTELIEAMKLCPIVIPRKGVVDPKDCQETYWDRLELERRLGN